ncbi:sensor histidine kinase [Bacillus proteolyticus]|uniref:sensor histidine kinase n=1 Tax=Bacillus proteolyticus TaxID=2026192 RepID=UPI0039C88C58
MRTGSDRSEEIQKARKQISSNISHDIRTPLTSIIGYINSLKNDVAASEVEKQEYLEILYKKSNDLKHLVDEIFNMAKLSKLNIELQVLIPEATSPIIADYLSLIRIIGNLIKNAIHYGKTGKIYECTARRDLWIHRA